LSLAPLAVSCGEPAGVGPEIAVAAWRALKDELSFVWLGDPRHLPDDTPFEIVPDCAAALAVMPRAMPVLPQPFAAPSTPGQPDLANAQGVIDTIATAVDLVKAKAASGLVTAPIHKKVLMDGAGFPYPGHTEYLEALGGGDNRAVMMLAGPDLRVVPTTIHIALSDVPKRLTPGLLRETIETTVQGLKKQFGLSAPRLVVAGLNPHSGEDGAMGTEELHWIRDLVSEVAKTGLDIRGPLPADTMFHASARAGYDAAICMYHDQAFTPIKTLDFDRGVTVTLGLPFIRTSPDHGTAFDIAGQGIARPISMIEACRLAWAMAKVAA
jgi:4-hydroxythreonine-4-phosphate dehydrogenase